jgi:hypothetical protein
MWNTGKTEEKRVKSLALLMATVLLLSVFASSFVIKSVSSGSGLIGYWKFDEGSGIAGYDSSGNGNTINLHNGPTWIEGKQGKALRFDGVDDYAEATENTELDPHTSNWTISAWVNIVKLSYGMYGGGFPACYGFVIACKRQSEHDSSLTLLVQGGTSATSQAKFAFVWDCSNQAGGAESTLMNVTGWHYVAGVRRGGQLLVYVDGAEFGPNNFGPPGNQITPTTNISSSTPIHLAHHGGWATYHNGTIDDIRIYNRALRPDEILDAVSAYQTIDYSDDFSVDTGLWTYSDNAYRDDVNGYVVLTEAVNAQVGAIWLNESLSSSFTVRFKYWVWNSTGIGTDGFVVMFYKQRGGALPKGGYLGFSGQGYGVEFDTFLNTWDPSNNHVALIENSCENHIAYVDDTRVRGNAWRNVTISVTTSSVVVYLDAGKILDWNGTLDLTYDGFGFAGATGEASFPTNDVHLIDDVSIRAPASRFDIALTPAITNTSIGGVTHCAITVKNEGGTPDLFNISISGLNSSWFDLGRDSVYLISGEMARIDLAISIPENPSAVGTFLFYAFVQESLGIKKNVSSQLIVVLNPIISDLEPAHETTVGSTNALFSWCTSSNASSEVYIKQAGDPTFNQVVGNPGTTHFVYAYNLSRNTDYVWYIRSTTFYGQASSDERTLHVSNGISFVQDVYTFNVERDYAQRASISVVNTDAKSHNLLLQTLNPYDDLIVGFVGAGSADQNVTLSPNQMLSVDFYIHAQDAIQQNYTFPVRLSNLGTEGIVDYALVNVNVRQPSINLVLVEEATDPVTLSKTVKATNYGDPITDLYIETSDELVGKVSFEPTVSHAYLPTGGSLTFQAVPVLTTDFTGCQGLITATSAGRVIASLPVNFTLPPGKRVFSVTVPQVSIEFSKYYDTDNSPNTNPLPVQLVESYLANGTKIFASQIIVDVYQNGTPVYDANVSLTVWYETGTIWSTTYAETDFTGKAMFTIFGLTGNYSYRAELAGYGITTEKRNFSVDTESLFEIHPGDITWLDVSDGNSTFDLSQHTSRILLDQAPFIFRAEKTAMDPNATFTLVLSWDFDKFKTIFIPGSMKNDTIVFNTSSIPAGNFSAVVAYYSNSSGLSLSAPINITSTDWSAMYLQGNYTYWQPFPLNSTHYVRLSIGRSVNSRDPAVAFDLYSIKPAGNNLLYNLTYVIGSNETSQKEFQIWVKAPNNVLYNRTFDLVLAPWKPALISFTIPAYYENGTLFPEFNSTISSGSLFVTISIQPSIHYIYDPRIWVGSFLGIERMFQPPPSMAAAYARRQACLTCGIGIAKNVVSSSLPGNTEGRAIGSTAVDYAVHADDLSRAILQAKLAVQGIGTVIGGLIGTALGVPAGPPGMILGAGSGAATGYIVTTTLWETGACAYNYWSTVQSETTQGSTGLGVCKVSKTGISYCTNTPVVSTQVPIETPSADVVQAAVVVKFSLPWSRDTYRQHNVHLFINGIEIGTLTNMIPEGYYIFPFNSSILNYAAYGISANMVTMKMDNLNGGHYVVTSDWEIILHMKQLTLSVVASNQSEANSLVERLSGMVASVPDFGIYPGGITCSNSQPREGQNLKFTTRIFNFGTVGMSNVPVDLYVDSVKANSAIISFLPALANQNVEFSWTAIRGTHSITITVNGAKNIPESDYSNNQAQTSITVFADDVAVANVTHAKNAVGQGFSFNVSATAANRGDFTETFNVTIYANTTEIETREIVLSSGTSTTLTFTWNTSGFAYGNYTISAYAWPARGETSVSDNTFKDGWVLVTISGDVNADRRVDLKDVFAVGKAYGSAAGDSRYKPNLDINGDGKIDLKDYYTTCKNYGKSW